MSTGEVEINIAVVGSAAVGKSALINQFILNMFLEDYVPSVFDWYKYVYRVLML